VYSPAEVGKIKKDVQGIIIPKNVGARKRLEILKKAKELNVIVLNLNIEESIKKIEDFMSSKKKEPEKKSKKDEHKPKEAKKAETEAVLLRENPPIYFRSNAHNAIRLSKSNGIKVILMTWAYNPQEFEIHLREAFNDHNDTIRELAVEESVALLDFERLMPPDREYWFEDGAHFTEQGAVKAAELVAKFLHEKGFLAINE